MKKYKIFLNILLIILAIAAVGIIAYMLYDYISNYILTQEAREAVELFEQEVSQGAIVVDIENNEQVNTIEPQTNTTSNTNTQVTTTTSRYKGYTVVGSIKIPKTNISYPVVDTITPNSIAVAVTAIYGPGLNEIGNTVLVAHNYRNGTFFSNNRKLTNGDKIYITDRYGNSIEYTIYNVYTTADSDFSYATRDTNGKREISLSTCTTDATKRLVIWASE